MAASFDHLNSVPSIHIAGVGAIAPGFAMLARVKRASHIDPPPSSYAIMRRACSYRGENPGPGKDVHGEFDHRPGIREQPGSFATGRLCVRFCLNFGSSARPPNSTSFLRSPVQRGPSASATLRRVSIIERRAIVAHRAEFGLQLVSCLIQVPGHPLDQVDGLREIAEATTRFTVSP